MSAVLKPELPSPGVVGIAAWRSAPGVSLEPHADELSVEEPLEIRVLGETLAVTMRTPGHDAELTAGFLLAEGLVRSRAELGSIAHCGRLGDTSTHNTVNVVPAPGVVLALDELDLARRGTLTTS